MSINLRSWIEKVEEYNQTISQLFIQAYEENWSALKMCNSQMPQYWDELEAAGIVPNKLQLSDSGQLCEYVRMVAATTYTNIVSNSLLFILALGVLIMVKLCRYSMDKTFKCLLSLIIIYTVSFIIGNILLTFTDSMVNIAHSLDNSLP